MLRCPVELGPQDFPIKHRSLGSLAEVEPLLDLCARGKLYEVEEWIMQGKPTQHPPPTDRKLLRR